MIDIIGMIGIIGIIGIIDRGIDRGIIIISRGRGRGRGRGIIIIDEEGIEVDIGLLFSI